MFTIITDKKDFIKNPVLEMNEEQLQNAEKDTIVLNHKKFEMYANEWKHHVHIKCTDMCDADCDFCIEKSERNNPQNAENMMAAAKQVIKELSIQNQLRTVSITGGEPTIFPQFGELVNMLNECNLTLLSINTNGRFLDRIPYNYNGWVDISKHAIDDRDVFHREFFVSKGRISNFKLDHKNAKVRFQCVLGTTPRMASIGDIVDYILYYKDYVDDFSFRNLIIQDNEDELSGVFKEFREFLYENAEFVEQCVQDYYVYETYKMFGTQISISWSNMKALRDYNESHDGKFLEEIIVHPDGTVSGSWNKKSLVIGIPSIAQRKTDKYLPCQGLGCEHKCKRYMPSEELRGVSSCSSSVPSCK